jgi:hypothetical protein
MQTMSVWPETGTPARWSPPEPRAVSGSPSGDRAARPSTAIPSGVRGKGSTQHPSGCGCEWRADDHAFGRRKSAASRLSTGTRVTAEGWRDELEPPAHPFGVVRWIATRSLRGPRRDCVGTERLRVPRADGVDPPFGVEPSASHGPFGARRDAAEALPSGFAGAHATDSFALFGVRSNIGRMEPDKAETLCLPHDCSGPGTPRELAREAKRPAGLDGAQPRGSIGTCRLKSPWEHRAVRSGNAAQSQRTPRWNKALRSALPVARRGNTEADAQRTTRRHANR